MRSLAILGLLGGIGGCVLAACNGSVKLDFNGTGGGGTTSSTTSTSSSSTTLPPLCTEAHDKFALRLVTPSGTVWSCDESNSEEGELVFTAQVTAMSGNALTLDACSPAADCIPFLHDLTFSAPGLYSYIPIGSYVEVRVHLERPWGCEHAIQIRNVPSWDGFPNPVYQDDRVWLVAADGSIHTFAGTPFTVARVGLDCNGGQIGCTSVLPDTYALVFDAGSQPVELQQGEGTTLTLSSPVPQLLDVRNLRSFQPFVCDDDWNWGYFAVQNMGVD